jgi:hypothetical protein
MTAVNKMLRTLARLAAGGALGLLTIWAGVRPLQAQDDGWTPLEMLYEGGRVDFPVLVADPYGQVHAFWVESDSDFGRPGDNLVYYQRLDDANWLPLDIFIVGGNGAGLTGAASATGLGLLINGGDFAESGPSPEHTAKDWIEPVSVQEAYPNAALAADPDGALWMAFGTTTGEINVQRQDISTGRWSAPKLVGDTANTSAAADWMRMAFSEDGTMHVVWAEYQLPNGWPPIGLFYARSTDGGETWSRRRLVGGGFNQPNVVTGPQGAVYVTWTGMAGVGGKYFQESLDNGQTWGDLEALLPEGSGGSEGSPNLVVDSAGGLHVIYSNLGCVWYTHRAVGQSWSDAECISAEAGPVQVLEFPTMTISLGHELHVMFWTERRQIWHTSLRINAPELVPLPIPVFPTATPEPPTATPVPTATTTPLPDFGPAPTTSMVTGPGLFSIAAGAMPVLLLIAFVFIGRRWRSQKS